MLNGVSKVEITNEDDVLITFEKNSSEGEVYTQVPLVVSSASGSELYAGNTYKVEFISYEVDKYESILEWMQLEKTVTAKVYSDTQVVNWDVLVPIKVEKVIETVAGKLIAFRITMIIKGEYDNIVAVAPYTWVDGNGNYFVSQTGTQILLYMR